MPYRSTGRPVGRPKTDVPKDYTSISLKIPLDLLARAQAYSAQHRQSLSTLLRDGLAMRLDDDPRWPALQAAQDDREEIQEIPAITSMPPLADVQAIVTLIDAAIQRWRPLLQVPGNTAGVAPDSSPRQHVLHVLPEIPLQAAHQHGEALEAAQGKDQDQAQGEAQQEAKAGTAPSFDPEKYYLGSLCARRHDWNGTGQSLRIPKKGCYQCKLLSNNKGAQTKRAAERLAKQI